MPHTNRKKKGNQQQRPKRTEMTDENGWTHITSTTPIRPYKDLTSDDGRNWRDTSVGWKRMVDEAPPHVTLQKLLDQYKTCETRFKESTCWKTLARDLQDRALHDDLAVDNCVCFGLGSPSAPSYHLDRRDVSMYQLAAFKAIADLIQERQRQNPIATFAQEPLFNTIDKELLTALSVTVLEHPAGFLHLTTRSFVFAPGHEQYVLKRILHYDPALLFGHDLEPYMGRDGRWREPTFGSSIPVLPDSSDEESKPEDSKEGSQDSSAEHQYRWIRKYKQANPPLHENIVYKKPQQAWEFKEDGKQMIVVKGRTVYVDGQRAAPVKTESPGAESPIWDGEIDAPSNSPSDSGSIVRSGRDPPSFDDRKEPRVRFMTEEEAAEAEKNMIQPEEALVKLKYTPQPANRSDLHAADLVVSYLADKGAIKVPPFEAHDHVFHENFIRYRLPRE